MEKVPVEEHWSIFWWNGYSITGLTATLCICPSGLPRYCSNKSIFPVAHHYKTDLYKSVNRVLQIANVINMWWIFNPWCWKNVPDPTKSILGGWHANQEKQKSTGKRDWQTSKFWIRGTWCQMLLKLFDILFLFFCESRKQQTAKLRGWNLSGKLCLFIHKQTTWKYHVIFI